MESNSCVNIQKMMETWGRVTNHGCFIDLIKIIIDRASLFNEYQFK